MQRRFQGRGSRVVRVVSAASLLAATFVATTAAQGAASPGVITGRVKLPAGTSSATVEIEALDPTASSAPTTSGVTDSDGNFAIAAPTGARTAALRATDGGVLNLQATATATSHGQVWVASKGFSVGTGNGSGSLSIGGQPIKTGRLSLNPVAYPASALLRAQPRKGCVPAWLAYVNDTAPTATWVVLDEIHAYYDATVSTLYQVGASSDFGVGISADGSHWSVSGTAHVTNTGGSGQETGQYGPYYGRQIQGEFTGVKRHRFYNDCVHAPTIQYQAYLYLWQGGLREGADVHVWDGCDGNGQGFCHQPGVDTTFVSRGGHFFRVSGHTLNYGSGISIFGITLGGTSTFSSNLQVDLYAGTGAGSHYVFGHGAPPTSSGAVYSY
jgi:hypothetical protein